jgi:choline dehydrogenase-like flavoprotein
MRPRAVSDAKAIPVLNLEHEPYIADLAGRLRERGVLSMNSHQCGTTVAGPDPATSVLDRWCKTHDAENLWAVDGGFVPSSAAMNPVLTIAAQELRVVAESTLAD